jgi:cytochrome P450
MSATTGQPFDVRDPAFLANPYPRFAALRAMAPVFKTPAGRWFITGYKSTEDMLRDRRFGKDLDNPDALLRRFGPTALQEPAVMELTHMMLMRNPPDHTRLRGLVAKAFTARRVEAMREWVRDWTNRLIDKVQPEGRMDLIRDLAFPVPVLVICEMLGIPEEHRDRFVNSSASGGALLNPTQPTREEIDRANKGTLESNAYFAALFEDRRRNPRDDLLTQMVQAEEAGERLSSDELRANTTLLFGAGHETTVNLLGNGFLHLLRNPDQWRMLCENPALIPNAIEEILRFESPVQAVARVPMEPVSLNGIDIPPETVVVSLVGAANRDPDVFQNPDTFDITRKDLKPLSFGGGIHFCLGAQLARIEAQVVLETVAKRLPDIKLADPENPKWRPSFTLRGLTELPAVW